MLYTIHMYTGTINKFLEFKLACRNNGRFKLSTQIYVCYDIIGEYRWGDDRFFRTRFSGVSHFCSDTHQKKEILTKNKNFLKCNL
jgi:hypothetical protein